jgi:hypothetical protein
LRSALISSRSSLVGVQRPALRPQRLASARGVREGLPAEHCGFRRYRDCRSANTPKATNYSHQPLDELGPAVGALDPATDALLDGALGLVHESRRLRRGATVLATSDESKRVVNRNRRRNAALASIAAHMSVSRAARRFWAKG